MLIREEALPFAAPLAVGAVVLGSLGHYGFALIPLVGALCVCAFFRDPERAPGHGPDVLVSPADGKVIKAASLGDGRVLVSVFMSVFNVHVNRAPCEGEIESVAYNPGKFMAAWAEKASLDNEQMRIRLSTPRGIVEVVQIAGLIARRIICWARPGKRFGRGERLGFIRFGSRVDLYMPEAEVEILVAPGQTARAGVTPLARWQKP